MIHCSLYSGGKSVVLAAPGSSQRTPLGPILTPLHVQKGRDDYFSFEALILEADTFPGIPTNIRIPELRVMAFSLTAPFSQREHYIR